MTVRFDAGGPGAALDAAKGDGAAAVPLAAVLPLMLAVTMVGGQSLMAAPLLPDIAGTFGVPAAQVGLGIGAFGGATALTALLLAPRLDRTARGRVLGGALALSALALATVAAAPGLAVLAVAQALGGVAAGIVLPTAYATAGDLAPQQARGRWVGRVLMGWSLALVLGVPVAGALGEAVGWRGVYALAAVTALGAAAAALRLDDPRPAASRAGAPIRLTALAGRPEILRLLAVSALIMAGFYGNYAYLGAHVRAVHGAGAGAAGALVLAFGLGFAAAAWLGGRVDRLGPARALALTAVALAATICRDAAAVPALAALLAVLAVAGAVQQLSADGAGLGCLNRYTGPRRPAAMAANRARDLSMPATRGEGGRGGWAGVRCRRPTAPSRRSSRRLLLVAAAVAARAIAGPPPARSTRG